MSRYPFQIVDVFGTQAFSGNPLAVIRCETELDTATMLRITRWLNFSETTFLVPPTDAAADYRLRIFTPARELSFAGHPTLGTCHAWLQLGGLPRAKSVIVQQCGAGLVSIRRDGTALAFAAPAVIRSGPVSAQELREIVSVLQIAIDDVIAAQWVDNGPGWVAVQLACAAAVLGINPVRTHGSRVDIGVVGFHPEGSSAAYEIRAFFSDPFGTIVEDPVCGSLNASVAQWLIDRKTVTAPYDVTQGSRLGRNGRIRISQDHGGQVWVGGSTFGCFSGVAEIGG
jgi:PhzF family phenazine biosynthesis protein